MQLISFDLEAANSLSVDTRRYFVVDLDGQVLVAASECPHRGGPLHLGKRSACGMRIVCPWHDNSYARETVARRSLPAVVKGTRISVVAEDGEVRIWNERSLFNPRTAEGPDV